MRTIHPMTAADRAAAELARIAGLADAATKGPWSAGGAVNDAVFPDSAGRWGDVGLSIAAFTLRDMPTAADAAFIAHARTDVPRLVAALEAVLSEVAALRVACAHHESIESDPADIRAHDGWRNVDDYRQDIEAAITRALTPEGDPTV